MRLPVTVIVLNNQILGYQKHAELSLFGDHTDVVDFEPVDHAALARACGCEGVRVERAEDFTPALAAALASGKVTVLDVVTDERAYPPITSFEGKKPLNTKTRNHRTEEKPMGWSKTLKATVAAAAMMTATPALAEVTFGALFPFSGGLALLGEESARGLEIAVDESMPVAACRASRSFLSAATRSTTIRLSAKPAA